MREETYSPNLIEEDDPRLRAYFLRVYAYMGGGLVITGMAAYLGYVTALYQMISGTAFYWVIVLAPLLLVLFLSLRIRHFTAAAAHLAFWTYAALVGFSLSGVFIVYANTSIALVFFISASAFLSLSLYGYKTKRNLSALGSFLFIGLIGLIIAGLVNILVASSPFQFALSVLGVGIFGGLTAWDTQKLAALYLSEDTEKSAVLGALMLYLDFLNLFLLLLRLLGRPKRD
jgi:FtsH-binding integral membrane protein